MPQGYLAVLVGLAVCQIGIVCAPVYLHRSVSHKGVTFSPPVRFVFRFLIWITTGIKPREWAAVHRKHHAYTDVEGDPHSPVLLGFWRIQLANAVLYRRVARDGVTLDQYAKDLQPDRLDKALFDHAYFGLGTGIFILCISLGWQWGLLAAVVHTTTYLALNAAINAFGHVTGRKTYENTAFNNQWLALLTAGEGLHNNHHAAPTTARLSHRKGELDPGWWTITALTSLHLARVRLNEPRLLSETLAGAPR